MILLRCVVAGRYELTCAAHVVEPLLLSERNPRAWHWRTDTEEGYSALATSAREGRDLIAALQSKLQRKLKP